ncbi:ABC transporter permease [Shewanella sp. GXUN23E]|uniref:ABC transporter permease n=1 Tax=Shewanella sp. GXUN23E TaxID=3422498 RepID=UPI003D7C6331
MLSLLFNPGNQRRRAPATLMAFGVLFSLILLAWLWPSGSIEINLLARNLPPSLSHPFGTDWLGRDMLGRTMKALWVSIWIGGTAVLLSGVLSLLLAFVAMLHPACRWLVDLLVDVFMSIPHLLLLILLSLALGGNELGLIAAVALSHWPRLTRLLRFEMLAITRMPFYKLARQFGQPYHRVLTRHLLPFVLPQWLVGTLLLLPHALVHMAGLTFLGFGLDPLTPSIGGLLSQSSNYLLSGQWWLGLFPGMSLILLVLLLSWLAGKASQTVRNGGE